MKTEVTKLLDDIQRILKKQKRTIADLARDLGRDYNQVYQWLEVRRFDPSAEATLSLMEWRDAWRYYIPPIENKHKQRKKVTS
jgi:hypothetical protein